MSSQLIGELGQVGLKIEEPTHLSRPNDCYSDEDKRKGKYSSQHRPKKFRQAWMTYDIFKDWLRPHTNPELANCIICNRVIKAGKSELEKHAAGKRHQLLRGGPTPLPSNHTQVSYNSDLIGPDLSSVVINGENTLNIGDRSSSLSSKIDDSSEVTYMETADFNSTFTDLSDQHVGTRLQLKEMTFGEVVEKIRQLENVKIQMEESYGLRTEDPKEKSSKLSSGSGDGAYHQGSGQHSHHHQQQGGGTTHRNQSTAAPSQPPHQQQLPLLPPVSQMTTKAIVGRGAPPWRATAIVNGHITKLELGDYRSRYLVLFFYPHDFNRVCASEVNALSDRIGEFRASQAEVVACSVDSHYCHLAWSKLGRADGGVGNPKIPLLSDPTHSIASDYGVLDSEKGHCLRGTFLIDRSGVLRTMSIYHTLIGRGIDELLRSVQALRFSDESDEAVPPDWSPSHDVQ